MLGSDNILVEEYSKNMGKILYSAEKIQARVRELGEEISKSYSDLKKPIIVVGMLKGAFMFFSDILRQLSIPCSIDFMTVSSYHGKSSTGNVQLKKDIEIDPYDRHVLIVEDLIDTGATLQWLVNHLQRKKCKSVKICCLIDKVVGREKGVGPKIDFTGFTLKENAFVVGYGMDFYNQEYRSLPFVGIPTKEAIDNFFQQKADKAKSQFK